MKEFYLKMIEAFNKALEKSEGISAIIVTELAETFAFNAKLNDPDFKEWEFWKNLGFD